ncbi:TPA: tetratricopeptide repeat protein [Candidatus Poribacteria bacterium]|nr:tetratricopeptide repeat protein [Candidatus Poribacteria bacterium]HIC00129.1 tetratricopeptide repeat protein [Candidatus Poribacteria bacterium]HIN29421.1 tetratricopeptide repeat protein [Candidatus Poribacteria bacterium]HIO47013.1 tetratricopeptide repeat protein [Candidatus Poribacteria bacterium]HIO80222.1 tetratricopeptide repeat protein [Candidatus Poribacteria bacterium]
MDTEPKLQEGIALHQNGQLQPAELIYQQILQVNPQNAEVLHLLGTIAHQVEKYDLAINLINQAIEIDPNRSSFFNNLGLTLQKRERFKEAIQAYKQAIELNSESAESYYNLGLLLQEQNRSSEAIQAYQDAIEINPNYSKAYNNLGSILKTQGKFEEAIQAYRQAIKNSPSYSQAHNNLGIALSDQGKLEEAIQAYQNVLKINPNHLEACNSLGIVLKDLGKLEESVQAYQNAIKINSNHGPTYNNLGNALRDQGKLEKAVQAYKQAIEINPQFPEAHHNLGTSLFLAGDFENCWKHYEWRWQCPNTHLSLKERHLPQRRWEGSELTDTSILVWAEQGVGDQITFASMFPSLLQAGAKVIVECEQRLIPLFKRSFPEIRFYPQESLPHAQLFDTNINYQIPMGSLGRWFRADQDSFSRNKQSYLKACPEETEKRRRKYQELSNGSMLVGISWKSAGPDQSWSESRSIPLNDYWASVLSYEDCYFINLQYGDVKRELELLKLETGLAIYSDQEVYALEDLDNFAAQVSALDLVISIDNTTVHIAGALGQRVWTLLPHIPYWRWMRDGEDTLWYKNMRLFRQDHIGDWSGVFQQVGMLLQQDIAENRLS